MKIGIIGPSKLNFIEQINNKAKEIIIYLSKQIAEKGDEIILTPDKESSSEFFAKQYIKAGGKDVFLVLPLDDKEFGLNHLNLNLGKHINCKTWRNQPEKLNEETDILLCIGYSAGVLAEIAYSKWFKPKPVYVINELISQELPKEIKNGLNLRYISFKEFGENLRDN